jgi:hypothetical protein
MARKARRGRLRFEQLVRLARGGEGAGAGSDAVRIRRARLLALDGGNGRHGAVTGHQQRLRGEATRDSTGDTVQFRTHATIRVS